MSRVNHRERVEQLEAAAAEEALELAASNSPESARSAADQDLARAPYLRIGDIVALRAEGIRTIDELEDNVLEVPEQVWPRVLDLVRSRVLAPDSAGMEATVDEVASAGENGDGEVAEEDPPTEEDSGPERCLAFTRAGDRCRNPARSDSQYCASHEDYQVAEETSDRCLALTKDGDRCRNPARSDSKYCASHKGYQPSQEELTARGEGLAPKA